MADLGSFQRKYSMAPWCIIVEAQGAVVLTTGNLKIRHDRYATSDSHFHNHFIKQMTRINRWVRTLRESFAAKLWWYEK